MDESSFPKKGMDEICYYNKTALIGIKDMMVIRHGNLKVKILSCIFVESETLKFTRNKVSRGN